MKECLEVIFSFIDNRKKLNGTSIEEIEKASQNFGISFPKPLIQFYQLFGNDDAMLNAFFEFERVENIKITNDAVVFCHGHQRERTYGILLNDINKENPPVKQFRSGDSNWYAACLFSTSFFVNMACWQAVNIMPSVARVKIVEDNLKRKIEKLLVPISQEKSIFLGYDFFSYYNKKKNILASYARELGELYLASEDDCSLNKFESESGLELDWL